MKNLKRVLLPLDFSDYSNSALRWAGEHFEGVELVFLHVWHGERSAYATWHGDPLANAKKHLQSVVEKFQSELGNPTKAEVVVGHPATMICKYAKDNDCDVIVMATHGLSGLKHLLVGSVAESVVRQSKVPVLTVPFGAGEL